MVILSVIADISAQVLSEGCLYSPPFSPSLTHILYPLVSTTVHTSVPLTAELVVIVTILQLD